MNTKKLLSVLFIIALTSAFSLFAQDVDTLEIVNSLNTLDFVQNTNPSKALFNNIQFWIPAIAIITPFLFAFAVVFIVGKNKSDREKLRHDIVIKALETGQQLPKEFFMEEKKNPKEQMLKTLKKSFILLFVGIAIIVWGLSDDRALFYIGLIVAMLGTGNLIYIYI